MSPRPPLKTLHLTNAFHPTSGGVRAVFRSLMAGANALGRPIRLVVPGPRHAVEDVGSFGRIYFVKAPRAFAVDSRYRLIMPWRYLLPWVDGIRQILVAEQPDVIEICDKHSLIYVAGLLRKGWMAGVPRPTLIANSAERFDDNVATFLSNRRAALGFARWFMRAVYTPMFDFHLANSEYTAEELRLALPYHRQQVVRVIPPSLSDTPLQFSDRGAARRAVLGITGGDDRTRLLVYVGRLSREKNLQLLVGMLERLIARERSGDHEYRLLIAGDGPELEMLAAARTRVRGRLHLLGNLPHGTAVVRLLESADVFVHPNPHEPFGLAPLEAMAAGLPVVVPDRGGVLSYADATTAWLAEPTPEAFASAVRAVVRHPRVAAARVAAGRARASAYHEDVIVPRYFSLLDDLHRLRLSGQAATTPDAISAAVEPGAATSR